MAKKLLSLVMLMALPFLLTSCVFVGKNNLAIHQVENEIVRMEAGKPFSPLMNGYFVSDRYMEEIMEVEVIR